MDNLSEYLLVVYTHREIKVTVDTPVSNAMSVVVLELLKSLHQCSLQLHKQIKSTKEES